MQTNASSTSPTLGDETHVVSLTTDMCRSRFNIQRSNFFSRMSIALIRDVVNGKSVCCLGYNVSKQVQFASISIFLSDTCGGSYNKLGLTRLMKGW
uniref:Uncharacterized protein n=1 Tax=Physcomitrium patens TaxID=3218 RepID=A0A2K1JQ95_PHYPA|nr:hypothetical protein PHYPA_016097 [Physcomitrium patens]